MRIILITLITCSICLQCALGQSQRFVTSGSIVFEKSVNIHALIKQYVGKDKSPVTQAGIEKFKETHPQFKKYTATLLFNSNEMLYTPQQQPHESILNYHEPLDDAGNITYTNLTTRASVTQKNVEDELFLVKDKTRHIKWRYTGETREIAGYTCRRANALIMDSVYVVAFFTDKIHVSGGPESFTGLPGMILGIALPYEHVTWFATTVTDTTLPQNSISPPKAGKVITNLELSDALKEKAKDRANTGAHLQRVFAL